MAKVSFNRAKEEATAPAAKAGQAPAAAPDNGGGGGFFVNDRGGSSIPPIEPGIYVGVLVGLYDLGTQHNETFQKDARKVVLVWELPDVRLTLEDDDGKPQDVPRNISKRYTLSLNEKAALRKDLEAVRGKPYSKEDLAGRGIDLRGLLGTNAQIQVTNVERDGKTFSNIAAMLGLPKGTAKRDPEQAPECFTFGDFAEGAEVVFPERMPQWVQDVAMKSPEYAAHNDVPVEGAN